jgi:2-aminoadipate transaminase
MDFRPTLNPDSEVPLYRQLYDEIGREIRSGRMASGERLPATRELAGLLGLNRTTVSAAYELLETEGLIRGQVGRGSFVTGNPAGASTGPDWGRLLSPGPVMPGGAADGAISFATSRPAGDLFPLDEFRDACRAVLDRPDLASILQLGSPAGYEPLRRYLMEEARAAGLATPADDLIVTSGCQQALDLIGRVLVRPGDTVAVEDPVYPGLKNLFAEMGAQLAGVPLGADGLDLAQLERLLTRQRPRLLALTPNFQNPTGLTLPLAQRRAVLEMAHAAGVPVIENDAYGELRYEGESAPPLKQLEAGAGGVVLLRSFSKVSFPGLRVGWVVGPKAVIDRLRQAKQGADLHTDQLSQAVLLEFVRSGRLERHRRRIVEAGRERLRATLEGCARHLPSGARFTRPEGGMNLWVELPRPLDAGELLARAQREGVAYLPGRYFAVSQFAQGALRLSFAGLSPEEIGRGLATLGRLFQEELERSAAAMDSAPAMV